MWRPWFEPDNSTEVISDDTDVTVIPETDEAQLNNKVDETTLQQTASSGPTKSTSSQVIPETQQVQHNCFQSPAYMQYMYLQSEHNVLAGKHFNYKQCKHLKCLKVFMNKIKTLQS